INVSALSAGAGMTLPADVRLTEPQVDASPTERSMTLGVHPPCRSPLTPERADANSLSHTRCHTTRLAQLLPSVALPVWFCQSGSASLVLPVWFSQSGSASLVLPVPSPP